ncbi:PAS domain S-box-containing protein [Cyclonatronum proteinivorum]|uniref:histidine kinase n=1 Tax=Cyclonatronum proteinivorum TaxID=1457365 RepID=A0A345UGF3_9BACT|nr:PAS domain S-box protein [Cyclonatronum proteinivorum]AXI99554.1 PAS domain S-box-containing protein [Cyclonatronum proteinivorum]
MLPPYLKNSLVSAAAVITPDGDLKAYNPAFKKLMGDMPEYPSLFGLIQSGSHGSLRRLCAHAAQPDCPAGGKVPKAVFGLRTLFTTAGNPVEAEVLYFGDKSGDEGLLLALFVPVVQNSVLPKSAPTDSSLQRDYLASIIAAIPDMLLIADLNGNIMEWGHAEDGKQGFVPAAGFEESALQGLLPARVRVAFRTALRQLSQGESARRVEYRLAGSGQDNWFEANLAPLDAEKVVILNRDITKRKETEDKIRLQEGMLRAIYDSADQAVTFIDKELRVLFFNKVAETLVKQVFGKPQQTGLPALSYILPGEVSEFEQHYRRALLGETAYFEKDYRGKWWRYFIYPVYDKAGNISGIAQNVADITDRKSREIELRENKERLNKTIEAIPHPLLIADDRFQISYVNEQFENVLGFSEAEATVLKLDALIPEAQRASYAEDLIRYFGQHRTDPASASDASLINERFTEINKADGQTLMMSCSYNVFINSGKLYTIIILQDVSELKRRQDIILRQNMFLRKIAWQQSHGVRRPIANILAISNMIQTDEEMTPEELQQYLGHLSDEVGKLDEIVKNIVTETNQLERSGKDETRTADS